MYPHRGGPESDRGRDAPGTGHEIFTETFPSERLRMPNEGERRVILFVAALILAMAAAGKASM